MSTSSSASSSASASSASAPASAEAAAATGAFAHAAAAAAAFLPPGASPRAAALAAVPPLAVESRFECGNLCGAVRTGPMEYELALDPDTNTAGACGDRGRRARGARA